jgi:hypothetical protein
MKSVFSKIAEDKTELASEKVELAGLKDMLEQYKEVQKNTTTLLKIRKEFVDKSKQLKSFGEIVQEQGKRLRELSLDLEKRVKDLGLDTPKEVDFYNNQASDFIATGKDAVEKSRI